MDAFHTFTNLFLHVDDNLQQVIARYGSGVYALLFGIIFAETGLVVTPFLPGDSLLFAAGIFAHPQRGGLNVGVLFGILSLAAILGDTVNYHIGKAFGHRLFTNERSRLFKRSHLDKTHAFFEKHGGKTIILARFVPIVRTFAPFVAGMGSMSYGRFLLYNVTGALLWVGICVGAGYFFGGIEAVRKHFELVVLAIILLSAVPIVFEVVSHRRSRGAAVAAIPPAGSE